MLIGVGGIVTGISPVDTAGAAPLLGTDMRMPRKDHDMNDKAGDPRITRVRLSGPP
jgi:hypothetical protein